MLIMTYKKVTFHGTTRSKENNICNYFSLNSPFYSFASLSDFIAYRESGNQIGTNHYCQCFR